MSEAYRLEEDAPGCAACGHGRTWYIVGPDDVALGTSYEDHSDADDLARELNDAYERGQAAAFATVARRIGPEDRRAWETAIPPDGRGERRKYGAIKGDGRRKGDDGIPF